MKIFRELYFRGDSTQLQKFTSDIREYATSGWQYGYKDDLILSWIYFDYLGDEARQGTVLCLRPVDR